MIGHGKQQAYTVTVDTKVTLNDDTGWRNWIGNRLRSLATRVDRRHSLAFRIHSQPSLTASQQTECIAQAFKALEQAVASECDAEALELAMRATRPNLYNPSKKAGAA